MTSRKFARLAAGAAGGADIGLWIVETVLSCCKRHIPRALRGGHRTKENNYTKLSEQKGCGPDAALTFRHAGPAYIITRRRIMDYYKDHSADWWRKNGKMGFPVTYAFSGLVVTFLLMMFENGTSIELLYFFIAFGMLIAQMATQKMCCTFLKNAVRAQKGEIAVTKDDLVKYDAIALWAWASDLAIYIMIYCAFFADDAAYLMIGLPIVGTAFIVMMILASVWTAKANKIKKMKEGEKDENEEK